VRGCASAWVRGCVGAWVRTVHECAGARVRGYARSSARQQLQREIAAPTWHIFGGSLSVLGGVGQSIGNRNGQVFRCRPYAGGATFAAARSLGAPSASDSSIRSRARRAVTSRLSPADGDERPHAARDRSTARQLDIHQRLDAAKYHSNKAGGILPTRFLSIVAMRVAYCCDGVGRSADLLPFPGEKSLRSACDEFVRSVSEPCVAVEKSYTCRH
jgi:hypothetical protein